VDQDTLFEIGSVSKPVTGLVLAHEIANNSSNNLTFDTPINSLLPDSVPDMVLKGELVTFRQLVTHTAGFPRLPQVIRDSDYNSYYDPNPYAGYSQEDMLRELSIAASELSQTGDYQYSNFGFSTLAYLLATSQNTTFPLLQRELLQRLGLDDTWIELPEEARQNLSTGYRNQEQTPYWFDGGLFINGGGSTLSSVRDMLTLVEVLMSPKEKLQDANLIAALELSLSSLYEFPSTDNAGVAFAWNYGGTPRFYSHGGATAGFVTYAAFQPATQTGVITLSNCGGNYDSATLGDALAVKLFVLLQSTS
jgi:CubicO group peptidase (beta-lactamase class C family)